MSNPANSAPQQTVQQGYNILRGDISTFREVRGDSFSPFGYLADIEKQTTPDDLAIMQDAARELYPCSPDRVSSLYTPEAQAAVSGLFLAAHMTRLARPSAYDPVVDLLRKRFDPLHGMQRQPNAAQHIEDDGLESLRRYELNLDADGTFASFVYDPRDVPYLKATFGLGASLLGKVVESDPSVLRQAADALKATSKLTTADISWMR